MSVRRYFSFLLEHRRFLAFGFALTFFSSFGQTFFIALFGGEIRAAYDLTDAGFGSVYSLATLASGLCLIKLGKTLDHVDLRIYTSLVAAGLIAACWLMSINQSVLWLGVAIFGLRITGQGLLGHTAMTSMARYFDETRGTALSLAGLGFPAGEAILPIAAVTVAGAVGWRSTWGLIALLLLVAMLPIVLLLLRGHTARHAEYEMRLENPATPAAQAVARHAPRSWTRGEVLRDPRFYVMLPGLLAPPFIVTGLFFHQVRLIESKGWTIAWFASCFVGFAAAQLPASLVAGPVLDRFGARRLAPFALLPLAAGLLTLALFSHPAAALAFLILTGVTSGAFGTVVSALWAEVYGVGALGAIRAMATAIMVFATAASPVLLGWLLEWGLSMETISLLCLAELVVGIVLLWIILRDKQPPPVG